MYYHSAANFQEIEHTADTGILIRGESFEDLFASAAFGYYFILYSDVKFGQNIAKKVNLTEPTQEDLLISWLSELNFLHAVNRFVLDHIRHLKVFSGDKFHLEAEIRGAYARSGSKLLKTEIKAVTYHQLHIKKTKNIYKARVFFDI